MAETVGSSQIVPAEGEMSGPHYDQLEAKGSAHILESGSVSYEKEDEKTYLLEAGTGLTYNQNVSKSQGILKNYCKPWTVISYHYFLPSTAIKKKFIQNPVDIQSL